MEFNRNSPAVRTVVQSSSVLIGQDLLIEILKRLPLKTLCRFLCVSKFWKTLISSSRFINLHCAFSRSATPPPNLKPYLRFFSLKSVFDLYHPPNHNSLVASFNQPFPANHHDFPKTTNHSFVGAIRGVVCLSYSAKSAFDTTLFWNPRIHKHITLPFLPSPVDYETLETEFNAAPKVVSRADFTTLDGDEDEDSYQDARQNINNLVEFVKRAEFSCSVIGFGYDASTDDFLVVRVWIPHGSIDVFCKTLTPNYDVYSSRAGIWNVGATSDVLKACGCFDVMCNSKTSCFVNGNINWITHTRNGNCLVPSLLMFDCQSRVFRIVEIPQEIYVTPWNYEQTVDVMEYAGLLSVVADSGFDNENETGDNVELWVMEEHGVAASWKKLYRFKSKLFERDESKLCDIYDDSFLDLAPYGPKQWCKWNKYDHLRYTDILSGHVYEESMLLMNAPTSSS